jgi:hypothetical protein
LSRRRPRHTTSPARRLPRSVPALPLPEFKVRSRPPRQFERILDDQHGSVLDVIDNLLNKGVVLNAELVLGLANVDLVYISLSGLLSAADRLRPRARHRRT